MPESVVAAQRCIVSCSKFGLSVEMFPAITPADDVHSMFRARGWPTDKFTNNRFSRTEPCMACFLSHMAALHQCAYSGESLCLLEHDAVMVRPLPRFPIVGGPIVCSLGKPSFGTFRTPSAGIRPLTSKSFVPGAHAVYYRHNGAEAVLAKAKECEPTDVFLNLKRFSFIKELYPWPFVCEDEFSTVQGPEGIKGKHRPVVIV